jgi:hypothetical protein
MLEAKKIEHSLAAIGHGHYQFLERAKIPLSKTL